MKVPAAGLPGDPCLGDPCNGGGGARTTQQSTGRRCPIQGCDFDALVERMGLRTWAREQMARDRASRPPGLSKDKGVLVHGVRVAAENLQPIERFQLFDLGRESILEPITNGDGRFRVTWYDHVTGQNSLPRRAPVSGCARGGRSECDFQPSKIEAAPEGRHHLRLKNLIGINGNKDICPIIDSVAPKAEATTIRATSCEASLGVRARRQKSLHRVRRARY